jgi:hypothetical protein
MESEIQKQDETREQNIAIGKRLCEKCGRIMLDFLEEEVEHAKTQDGYVKIQRLLMKFVGNQPQHVDDMERRFMHVLRRKGFSMANIAIACCRSTKTVYENLQKPVDYKKVAELEREAASRV